MSIQTAIGYSSWPSSTSVVVKKPTLPTPMVKYTPTPSPSSYYSNYKAVTSTKKASTASTAKSKTSVIAAPKPKTTAVKTVAAPVASASANYQTVAAPQAAPPAPTLDDLINKYYSQSTNDVNSMYDQQKNSQLAQLKAQRDAAIGKINQQQDQTKQDYYNQRNQADVVNAQNVQKLRELMAANGVSASGENLTLNAQANSDRLNALNSLNQQEQAKMNDYASQITDWNNPSRDQAITNQIDAARTQALLNAKNNAYSRAWNEWQFNNPSAAQQAQLAMTYQSNLATNAANNEANQQLINYYNSLGFNGSSGGGVNTAGNAAYQQNLAKANSLGLPTSSNSALSWLVQHESGFNPAAKNPKSTAYGYAQFLNSTRSQYEKKMGLNYNDPVDQLLMMYQYTVDRYGSPENAVNFWKKNSWY